MRDALMLTDNQRPDLETPLRLLVRPSERGEKFVRPPVETADMFFLSAMRERPGDQVLGETLRRPLSFSVTPERSKLVDAHRRDARKLRVEISGRTEALPGRPLTCRQGIRP
jgi:hypothetical protein